MSRRRIAATRRLGHLLLQRAAAGRPADPDTAVRLLDARAASTGEDRRRVVREALALSRAAASALGRDARLQGELRTDLRIALRDRTGKPFSVLVPSLVQRPDGSAAVLVLAPAGDGGAAARARRYRFAVGSLTGHRAAAFLVHPDGTVEPLATGRAARQERSPRRVFHSAPSG